jgi:hypothetical protein
MTIAGEGSVIKHKTLSFGDTFLKICMELGKVMRFSKTTGYKLTHPPWWPIAAKSKMADEMAGNALNAHYFGFY